MPPPGNFRHEEQKSEQTHIGIAYPSIPETHEDYYTMRLAMEVLSGGTSGRLFPAAREKRALVYNAWAGHSSRQGTSRLPGYTRPSSGRRQGTPQCLRQAP